MSRTPALYMKDMGKWFADRTPHRSDQVFWHPVLQKEVLCQYKNSMTLEEFAGEDFKPGDNRVQGAYGVTRGMFAVIATSNTRLMEKTEPSIHDAESLGTLGLNEPIPEWARKSDNVDIFEPKVDLPIMDCWSLNQSLDRCADSDSQRRLIAAQLTHCVRPRAENWSDELVQELYSALAEEDKHESREVSERAMGILYDEKRLDRFSTSCNMKLSEKIKRKT